MTAQHLQDQPPDLLAALHDSITSPAAGTEQEPPRRRRTSRGSQLGRAQQRAEADLRRRAESGRAGDDALALVLDALDEARDGQPPEHTAHNAWRRAAGHLQGPELRR